MAQDVEQHCRECQKCQSSKPPMPSRAPLTNLPIGRPWQMVAIDILQVPVSINNNKYLLVIQDYFTKWADAIPLQNQRAVTISAEMVKVFCTYGIPDIVHSDQGQNFESTVFHQTLKAFGVEKSCTTTYHPEDDGMVERFNRSLLQLLRTYVEKEEDWEKHLPLALYAYRTAVHSSTGGSPFMLMYGREPSSGVLMQPTGYDASDFSLVLQSKLSQLQDLVEANNTEAAHRQKLCYDKRSSERRFKVGDTVWLSIPTAGKLDPHWEGRWSVKSVKTPLTVEITDGVRTKIVHVNRIRQRVVPNSIKVEEPSRQVLQEPHHNWEAPQIDHFETPGNTVPLPVHRENQDVAQDYPNDTKVLSVQPEHIEIPQGNDTDDQQHTEEERRYPERIRRPYR